MREHEVPTHVQAEDKVLLWFTFPQIVAVLAVCAVSYGAYRYAPFGPSEVRLALAALLGMVGIAMIVGKVGGRGLPLVVADLLKYRLGARRYAGSPAELARPEAPAPDAAQGRPNPLLLLAQRIGKRLSGLRASPGVAVEDVVPSGPTAGSASAATAGTATAAIPANPRRPGTRSPGVSRWLSRPWP